MALPDVPLPTGSVTIGGTDVPIRSLARSEVLRIRSFVGAEDDAEPFIVACGTGCTPEEATAWLGAVELDVGGVLVEAILALTGLLDPQEGATGDGPDARSTSAP